jgi:hypothetical protein
MNRPIQFALAAAVLVAAACQKDSSPIKTTSSGETNVSPPADSMKASDKALVRIVNATKDGKVSVQLGTAELFNDVKSGSVTDYREVTGTLADFTVRAAGHPEGIKIAEKERVLRDGNRYTVLLIAEDVSKSTLHVIKDEVISEDGKARLRVLHAAPGGPEFDISIKGAPDKLFTDVGFMKEAGYKDLTPEIVTVEFRAKGKPQLLLTVPKLDLKQGTATTIVVTGAAKLGYFTFNDAQMAKTPKA